MIEQELLWACMAFSDGRERPAPGVVKCALDSF